MCLFHMNMDIFNWFEQLGVQNSFRFKENTHILTHTPIDLLISEEEILNEKQNSELIFVFYFSKCVYVCE